MANWYGTARSNYFRVKDTAAFLLWAADLPGVEAEIEDGKAVLLAGEEGGWPNYRELDEPYTVTREDGVEYEEYDEEIDLAAELAEHLEDGEVAILQEVGAEKLRYVTGYSLAVRSDGSWLKVDIDDIYNKVKEEWAMTPTVAAY